MSDFHNGRFRREQKSKPGVRCADGQEWCEVMDTATAAVYFWHSATDEVVWSPPEGGTPRNPEAPASTDVQIEQGTAQADAAAASNDGVQHEAVNGATFVTVGQAALTTDVPPTASTSIANSATSAELGASELKTAGVTDDVAAWVESLLLYLRYSCHLFYLSAYDQLQVVALWLPGVAGWQRVQRSCHGPQNSHQDPTPTLVAGQLWQRYCLRFHCWCSWPSKQRFELEISWCVCTRFLTTSKCKHCNSSVWQSGKSWPTRQTMCI